MHRRVQVLREGNPAVAHIARPLFNPGICKYGRDYNPVSDPCARAARKVKSWVARECSVESLAQCGAGAKVTQRHEPIRRDRDQFRFRARS